METQKNSSKIKVKPRSRRDIRNIADTLKKKFGLIKIIKILKDNKFYNLKKYFFEYLEKQEENLNKSGILTAMRM